LRRTHGPPRSDAAPRPRAQEAGLGVARDRLPGTRVGSGSHDFAGGCGRSLVLDAARRCLRKRRSARKRGHGGWRRERVEWERSRRDMGDLHWWNGGRRRRGRYSWHSWSGATGRSKLCRPCRNLWPVWKRELLHFDRSAPRHDAPLRIDQRSACVRQRISIGQVRGHDRPLASVRQCGSRDAAATAWRGFRSAFDHHRERLGSCVESEPSRGRKDANEEPGLLPCVHVDGCAGAQ